MQKRGRTNEAVAPPRAGSRTQVRKQSRVANTHSRSADRTAERFASPRAPNNGAALTQRGVMALQRTAGNQAAARLLGSPSAVQRSRTTVQRWAPPDLTGYQPATYEVGGVTYKDDQWTTALNQIANLWTDSNGILAKRKEAVDDFVGPGGAGAAKESSLTESLLEAALIGLLTIATDGIGIAVAGLLAKGVSAAARRVAAEPEAILKTSEKIIEKVVDLGKEKTKDVVKEALKSVTAPALATPLATYGSALKDALDRDTANSKRFTLQQLLLLPDNSVARWAAASAIYDALHETIERAKEIQWSATSDGWFRTQTQSGINNFLDVDQGIVSIVLSGTYPTDTVRAKGAYLGGPGANETTVERYNERQLGEVRILKRIIMDGGKLGHGLVDCNWEFDVDVDGNILGFPRESSRWGYAWLAAKHLHLRNLNADSPEVQREAGYQNVSAAADEIWSEIRTKSAKELGTKFEVTGPFSGTGSYAPPQGTVTTDQPTMSAAP